MGHVGGELIWRRIERDPIAEPGLRPRMIVKSAAQIDDADDGFCRYSRRAGQGIEEDRMLVAITSASLENFQRIGNTDRGLFGNLLVNPLLDLDRRAVRIPLTL